MNKLLKTLEDAQEQLRQAWACIEHLQEHATTIEREGALQVLKDIENIMAEVEQEIAVLSDSISGSEENNLRFVKRTLEKALNKSRGIE